MEKIIYVIIIPIFIYILYKIIDDKFNKRKELKINFNKLKYLCKKNLNDLYRDIESSNLISNIVKHREKIENTYETMISITDKGIFIKKSNKIKNIWHTYEKNYFNKFLYGYHKSDGDLVDFLSKRLLISALIDETNILNTDKNQLIDNIKK